MNLSIIENQYLNSIKGGNEDDCGTVTTIDYSDSDVFDLDYDWEDEHCC